MKTLRLVSIIIISLILMSCALKTKRIYNDNNIMASNVKENIDESIIPQNDLENDQLLPKLKSDQVFNRDIKFSVTLAWDANIEADLAGYKVYYSVESNCPNDDCNCDSPSNGVYNGTNLIEGNSPITFPLSSLSNINLPQVTLTGLSSTYSYYFVVTAYDTENLESDYSNQVCYLYVDDILPAPPTNIIIMFTLHF